MIKCKYMGYLGSEVGLRQRSFITCTRHRLLLGRSNKEERERERRTKDVECAGDMKYVYNILIGKM
jgi:hypothetical protein